MVFQEFKVFVYAAAAHCPDCSRVEVPSAVDSSPDLPPLTFDVSQTLDGAVVASSAFRSVCELVDGIRFEPIDAFDARWVVEVDRTVRVDPFGSHVRAGPKCETCGQPRYVTRSGPLHLETSESLEPGFSRTDIELGDTADFGSSQPIRLRPSLLIDRGTARLLKASDLLGVHLITQP